MGCMVGRVGGKENSTPMPPAVSTAGGNTRPAVSAAVSLAKTLRAFPDLWEKGGGELQEELIPTSLGGPLDARRAVRAKREESLGPNEHGIERAAWPRTAL